MSTIAVVGATGNVGSRLVARLANEGHEVRAISRSPGQPADGIEWMQADLADANQAIDAFDGVNGVYLTPTLSGDQPLLAETLVTTNVIDAAAKQGVEHLILHTALDADRGDTGAGILDNKTPIEVGLADSGVGYTILRPAWFLQNLWAARDYIEQGVVSMPWSGDMVWGATDINDIVTAAAAFFELGPTGSAFDIHIPGGITGQQIADAAADTLGKEVLYHEADVSTRDYVDGFPISDAHKDLYAELFDYFRSTTYLGDTAPIAEALDGFTPRGLNEFLSEELFAEK
jgi:uncharacterized protein YbjT (DUF2867 family)